MERHWRGGAEPDAEKSLSERKKLAAHLHFESKDGSANILSQTVPKGLPNRIKVVKETIINELINFMRLKEDFW